MADVKFDQMGHLPDGSEILVVQTVARVDPPARRPANSSAAGAILAFTGGAQGLLAAVGMALLAAGLALLTLRRRHARSR